MNDTIRSQGCCFRGQSGFTLIELILVVVILGLLAAVAVPRFADLSGEAEVSAADGIYAAAQSATSTNFAATRARVAGATPIIDGATLLGAMDGTPRGWSAAGAEITFVGQSGTSYTITVAASETEHGKAMLTRSW